MKFNSINTVYFSPTNGTKRIIEEIVSNLNINEVITSDITDYDKRKYNINVNEDLAIIGVPVYYGRVEKTAAAYLKEHLNGNNTPAIIVAVYGNRHFDDALVELHDLVKDNSFNVIAAGAFIGEHSFSNEKHLIGANRPDKADINHVKLFVEDILQKIETTNDINSLTDFKIYGNRPYKDLKEAPKFIKKIKYNQNSCNSCNVCVERCPMNAISENNTKEVDYDACISCMKCVKDCPTDAKSMGFVLKNIAASALSKNERREPEYFL